jgi:Neuraminidase (sialidase)
VAPPVTALSSQYHYDPSNGSGQPNLSVSPDGRVYLSWIERLGGGAGTYAYDVNISRSFDGGKTWGNPFVPHRDGTQTEHGE